jgi:hypothetical protein
LPSVITQPANVLRLVPNADQHPFLLRLGKDDFLGQHIHDLIA